MRVCEKCQLHEFLVNASRRVFRHRKLRTSCTAQFVRALLCICTWYFELWYLFSVLILYSQHYSVLNQMVCFLVLCLDGESSGVSGSEDRR